MNSVISERKQTLKLDTSAIVGIVQSPDNPSSLIVASSGGKIFYLQTDSMKVSKTIKVFNTYCLCLAAFEGGVVAGNSHGELAYLTALGELKFRIKLHTDSLSGIVETDEYLVTIGFDGLVKFLNKTNFQVERELDLGTPLWSVKYFEDHIYTAGNPSYSISCSSFEVGKMKRFDKFAVYQGRFYGCSDERGFTCLTNNSNSYIPCNFMLTVGSRMMIFSEECIGEITHRGHIEWKCHRIREINQGTSIVSGLAVNENTMVVGDIEGMVYKVYLDPNQDVKTENAACDQ